MLLTIVTITKDDPEGLARTLTSTANFIACPEVEQLVVFAGDEKPANRHQSVTVMPQTSAGIAGAFNEGISRAKGEWIWFLNGGDRIDQRLTPEHLFALLRGTRAEIMIGETTYEGELEPRAHPPGHLQWPPLRSWIPHPSTVVRRRLFAQFGGFDERYLIAMDYEWWLRVFSRGTMVKFDVVSVPFSVFAPGGVSQQPMQQTRIALERDDAIRRHQKFYWQAWLFNGGRLVRAWLNTWFGRRLSSSRKK